MEWLEERSARGKEAEGKKCGETSGGGGGRIERGVSPVLDCFSLIALH